MSLQDHWHDLQAKVKQTLDKIKNDGVTSAEAFYTLFETTNVEIRNSELFGHTQVTEGGVGFRVEGENNKVGFTSTNSLATEKIMSTAENARKLAKISTPNPNFSIPEKSQARSVRGLYDPDLVSLEIEEIVQMTKLGLETAENSDKRVTVKWGVTEVEHGFRGVINTSGVYVEDRESSGIFTLMAVGIEGDQVTGSRFEFEQGRRIEFDPERVGKRVSEEVLKLLNPQEIKSFEGPVIFSPEAVSYQIFQVIRNAIKGDNVLTKRSAWSDKIGDQVGSETLFISDNATLDRNFASHAFDDEGSPTQYTNIVEKGELKSFIQDCTSAKGIGGKSTANASRYGSGFDIARAIIGNGYKTQPEVHPLNLTIQPGSKSRDELIAETQKGILIESMAGFPQAGSGFISAQLSQAFLISNGAIQFPLKNVMIAGNGYEWLKQISGISSDSRQFSNRNVPSLRVEGVKIIGSQ